MRKEVVLATLRLFNAVEVVGDTTTNCIDKKAYKRGIKNGYLLQPEIQPTPDLQTIIEEVIGISGQKANATFHKSWSTVRDASDEQLVMQQILHYLTTYGFEALGVYSEHTVYIPVEDLDLPKVKKNKIPLTVVKAFTKKELLEAIVHLGSIGIALHEDTLIDIMTIVEDSKFNPTFIDELTNHELKARVSDFYGLVPQKPVDFLRYVVSKLTDESLLIKNEYLIGKIKESNGKYLDDLMRQAPNNLASIFLRYKPLFLAMKSISKDKAFYNQLRKKAKVMHKPLKEDYLSSVTKHIKNETFSNKDLKEALKSAPVFKKVRLAYALQYRLNNPNSIVYTIRTGRGWADKFNWDGSVKKTAKALNTVVKSIAKNINIEGKEVIYIPQNVFYALPATEKQFTGNLPSGTFVKVPKDLIIGVHWENQNGNRIDLDLSGVHLHGKIGWDANYRDSKRSVMFSGDITDAPPPKGATESFFFEGASPYMPMLLTLNYFNHRADIPVPMKLFVASDKPTTKRREYTVNINKLVAQANMTITEKQNVLGLYAHIDGTNRFYFSNVSVGNGITSRVDDTSIHTREYLLSKVTNPILLNDLLVKAGATVVHERPDKDEEGNDIDYLDLSPEALDKSTIIDLLIS